MLSRRVFVFGLALAAGLSIVLCATPGEAAPQSDASSCGTVLNEGQAQDCMRRLVNEYCAADMADGAGFCEQLPPFDYGRYWLVMHDVCAGIGRSTASAAQVAGTCATFRTQLGDSFRPLVLAYDHAAGRWSAQHGLTPDRIKKDIAGTPTVALSKDERLTVVVENSNPLVFGIAPGTPKEEDLGQIAALQEFLKALGGGIAGVMADAPVSMVPEIRQTDAPTPIEVLEDATTKLARHISDIELAALAAVNYAQSWEFEPPSRALVFPARIRLDRTTPATLQHEVVAVDRAVRNVKPGTDQADAALKGAAAVLKLADAATLTTRRIIDLHDRYNRTELLCLDDSPTDVDGRAQCIWDTRLYFAPEPYELRWNKVQTYPFEIGVDTPFVKQLVVQRPDGADAQYKLVSATRTRWGAGIGMVYTPLVSPVYGAVADPDDEDAKIIAVTEQESRAGRYTAFLNFRLRTDGFVRPGLELGAALDVKTPGFFPGVSLEISDFARIGVGYGIQQVTQLNGQMEGDRIKSKDDIRTKKGYDGRWYVSFTFALDSLALFVQ